MLPAPSTRLEPTTPHRRSTRGVARARLTLSLALVVALGGAGCAMFESGRESIETPPEVSTDDIGERDDGTGATAVADADRDAPGAPTEATTLGDSTVDSLPTTSTTPPNPLLAPPPTVRPALDQSGPLAPLVSRVDTTDRVVFITIDDGYVQDPAVLEHLENLGVPYTSFLTLPAARVDPEFWRRTQHGWGMIETHTINHPNLRTASEATQRREICGPLDEIEQIAGRRPTLFRPPYGNWNDSVLRIAKECGYHAVVLWTGSANNGKVALQKPNLLPGDVILMHWRETLKAEIDDLIARCVAEGFTIGRLEDYLSPGV